MTTNNAVVLNMVILCLFQSQCLSLGWGAMSVFRVLLSHKPSMTVGYLTYINTGIISF